MSRNIPSKRFEVDGINHLFYKCFCDFVNVVVVVDVVVVVVVVVVVLVVVVVVVLKTKTLIKD